MRDVLDEEEARTSAEADVRQEGLQPKSILRQGLMAYPTCSSAEEQTSSRASADEEAAAKIDLYIRTRRRFNTSDPVEYACNIASIEHECHHEASRIISIFNGTRFTILQGGHKVRVRHLTPFQGPHRVYGKFR